MRSKLERLTALKLCFSLNISPRTRDEVARALSAFGLSLRRVEALLHVPRSTVHYYWRKLGECTSPLTLNGYYAVDETGIRVVNNSVYWLWVVRDLNTVVAVRLSETRSRLDVILLFEGLV